MRYTSDSYNTKDWTNILLKKPLTEDQWQWLQTHDGGFFHIHRSGTAVKFERKADAEWFLLRLEQ